MTVKITGAKVLLNGIKKFGGDADKAEKRAVYLTANEIKNTAVDSILAQSAGETVKRQKQKGSGTYNHVASKPGDAPNSDTGNLVKSISIEPTKPAKTMYVGANSDYASHLEFGTRKKTGGTLMEARPFMQPAIDFNEGAFMEFLSQEYKKLLK